METRFKKVRVEYEELLKDKNPKARFSQKDLAAAMKKRNDGYYASRSEIGKLETGIGKISDRILIAYHNFFGVNTDWLLGLSNTKYPSGDLHTASITSGLSEKSIQAMKNNFSKEEYFILNAVLEDGSINKVLQAVIDSYPNFHKKSHTNILNDAGMDFYRYRAFKSLQEFIDSVQANKNILNFMLNKSEKLLKKELTDALVPILRDALSDEKYAEFVKTGKKYGFDLPE